MPSRPFREVYCAPPARTPATQLRPLIIIIVLNFVLILCGVAPTTAVATVSAAGLAAVEILRRLATVPAAGTARG